MAEIFKEAQAFNEHPNRSNHDLSKKIYGTFKAGYLYPVYSRMLCPTDSIRMDIATMLQFMPTITPLQSKMRATFHVFVNRMKNLHKDWPNTLEMLEEHEFPYVLPSALEFKAGSIHDYLGVPCVKTYSGNLTISNEFFPAEPNPANNPRYSGLYYILPSEPDSVNISTITMSDAMGGFSLPQSQSFLCPSGGFRLPSSALGDGDSFTPFVYNLPSRGILNPSVTSDSVSVVRCYLYQSSSYNFRDAHRVSNISGSFSFNTLISGNATVSLDRSTVESIVNYSGYSFIVVVFTAVNGKTIKFARDYVVEGSNNPATATYDVFVNGSFDLCDFPDLIPYATSEHPERPIKLRAWRYRAYEASYNCFYRNSHGAQPFKINGQPVYNRYNTTVESGADRTHYDFFKRNWELDAYTSALTSPQQGNPPLIGVTSTGRLTVRDDDGTTSTAQLQDLDDGSEGVAITRINAETDEHRRLILSLADSGISINDLREANALQKFLETNIRKGFRYVDFITGHFGKGPRHTEMDMPEYIGGCTVKLDVGKVTNTNSVGADSDAGTALGQFAGTAQMFGTNKHQISYYADDYCMLQVIMCIVPDNAYSQILPKEFLYSHPLDIPFPNFANLSYQPIDYREICPIEAYNDYLQDNSKQLTDVFGYQRPYYECVSDVDTVHGQFLTTMARYAINRHFLHRPELGDDFLTIDPVDAQQAFTLVTDDDDICYGQIGFKITIKRPFPRVVIPSIGR